MVVEMDEFAVFQALKSPVIYEAPFGLILQDYLNLVKKVPYLDLNFVRCTANYAAHLLAQHSAFLPSPSIWEVVVPEFLIHVLADDLS